MEISNIQDFLGGADEIFSTQLVQGSASNLGLTVNGSDGAAVNLLGHIFEFDTVTATGTITPDATNPDAFTLSNLTLDTPSTPVARDALVTVTDATNGMATLYLPSTTLFTGTLVFDSNTAVPIVIGTMRRSDGATTNPTIRSTRVLIVIRYGVIA